MAKARKRTVITPDRVDNEALMLGLESQGNAIPPQVATVIRIVAPILARMAIRYVARRFRKKISEQAVNTAGAFIGKQVQEIIDRAAKDSEKK